MFYLLNFQTHTFTSCNSYIDVRKTLHKAKENGFTDPSDFEVIDCFSDDIRRDIAGFDEVCRVNGMRTYQVQRSDFQRFGGQPIQTETEYIFDNVDAAEECIRKEIEKDLVYLNQKQEKVDVCDSDGKVICRDYPFRNDPDGEYPSAILFWDGDDYFMVIDYAILEK